MKKPLVSLSRRGDKLRLLLAFLLTALSVSLFLREPVSLEASSATPAEPTSLYGLVARLTK